jgi:hypothetical protein
MKCSAGLITAHRDNSKIDLRMLRYNKINKMKEMIIVPGTGVWIAVGVIGLLCIGVTIWITNKAYSKKWDE